MLAFIDVCVYKDIRMDTHKNYSCIQTEVRLMDTYVYQNIKYGLRFFCKEVIA